MNDCELTFGFFLKVDKSPSRLIFGRNGYLTDSEPDIMRHLIDRVLELQDDEEETDGTVTKGAPSANNAELHELLKSLQPRIRVYGCGGCGGNTVDRLNAAGLLDEDSVRGYAVNTDACLLYTSPSPRD